MSLTLIVLIIIIKVLSDRASLVFQIIIQLIWKDLLIASLTLRVKEIWEWRKWIFEYIFDYGKFK